MGSQLRVSCWGLTTLGIVVAAPPGVRAVNELSLGVMDADKGMSRGSESSAESPMELPEERLR